MTISIPSRADLDALPALPRDDEGPVFKAPWEAQAFAITFTLREQGLFTWAEWSAALAAELAAAAAGGERDDGSHYYEHWLAALEGLVAEKHAVSRQDLQRHVAAWDAAIDATPHGQPIAPPA
jgi:nitrile hydratase accessory protein